MSLDKSQALNDAKQYVLQGNVQAAVDSYRKIIEDDPSDLTTRNTLGDLYIGMGQVQDAIAQFSRIADCYIEHGFARKAIATLKKIISIDPANTETATKLADLYAQAGLPSEARQHYVQIAEALTRKGATVEALTVFSKVVELDPSNTSTRIKLGELYLREGLNEQAYKEFVTAADQLSSKGEHRRALNAYNEALAVRPDSREALKAIRRLMSLLGVPIEKSPRKPTSPNGVTAELASDSSSRAGAEPSNHKTTADLGPSSDRFVVQEISKAEILVAYGQVNQALSMLRQVLVEQPDNIDVHIKLKDIYLRTGMMTEAAHECVALERIHEARGEPERARDYAVRASRLTQLIEQPSGDLPKPKPKHREVIEPRVASAPIEAASQRDPSMTPRPVLTSAPPEIIRRQPAVPKPHLEQSGARASASQNNRLSFSEAPSKLDTVEVLSSSDTDLRPVLISNTAHNVVAMAETKLAISPAQQTALVPITSGSADSRERNLPVLFAGSHYVNAKRGRLTAAGIAAGVFVLLGAGALIGGVAYDAHLEKQYKELSLTAPVLVSPPPPAVHGEEIQPVQENEAITVEVTATAQTEARRTQNSEPEPSKKEQPVLPQPASETPRIVNQPPPMPPRAITSPDVRGGTETRTPAGVPVAVPVGSASPAEPPPKLVRQSPGVVLGSAIKRVDPGYPATARVAQQAGAVAVEVTISEQGNVTSARALSGPSLLRNAAVAAARGWKFKPSMLGGVPVTTTTTIVFNFKL